MKSNYIAPAIIKEVILEIESEILAGSHQEAIDENCSVESVGQEVIEIKADQWTSNWE